MQMDFLTLKIHNLNLAISPYVDQMHQDFLKIAFLYCLYKIVAKVLYKNFDAVF